MPDANEAALPTEHTRTATIVIVLAALAGFVASAAMLYPGQYPFDSAYQLWQARTGQYSNITPVPMPWIWSLLLGATGNAASLLLVNLAMFWTGLALCFHSMRAPSWFQGAGILICGLNPLALVQMGHVLTDAHLAAVLVLATGAIAHRAGGGRSLYLWLAWMLIVYAGCIRHNALLAAVPLGALAACLLARLKRRPAVVALIGAATAGILSLALGATLDRAITVERRTLWPMLALWDLAAISVATDELHLPAFTHGVGLSPSELRETGAFDPTSAAPLFARSRSGIGSGLNTPYSAERERALSSAWRNAVVEQPTEYVSHRLRTMVLLLGRHAEEPQGIAYYVSRTGYRDNPPLPEALMPGLQKHLYTLAERLRPTWVFSALPYLMVHLACLPFAWRRRHVREGAVAVCVSASALLYAASFTILAPSAELRFLTWPLVAAALAFGFLGASLRSTTEARRSLAAKA